MQEITIHTFKKKGQNFNEGGMGRTMPPLIIISYPEHHKVHPCRHNHQHLDTINNQEERLSFIFKLWLLNPCNKVTGCVFVCMSVSVFVCVYQMISLTAEPIGFSLTGWLLIGPGKVYY